MPGPGKILTLRNLTLLFSCYLLGSLLYYFMTGAGGPRFLAVKLVPIALIIQMLVLYQQRYFYRWLPAMANHAVLILYLGICLYAMGYLTMEYEEIAIWRQAAYNQHDFIVGLLMFLLVMELSRQIHPILFWVNLVLVGYTLWGNLSPIDFFWHPSVSLERVITSSTVEFSTGVFGRYSQLALTLIAAFLLLAAAASGFGAQRALVNVMRHSSATLLTMRIKEHPALYQLVIADNGKGASQAESGLGLQSIRERVETLNGQLRITTEAGFELFITIPKKEANP